MAADSQNNSGPFFRVIKLITKVFFTIEFQTFQQLLGYKFVELCVYLTMFFSFIVVALGSCY